MGFLDKARAKAAEAADKHGDKMGKGLDKAGELADKRTKGRQSDKIASAKQKATGALGRLSKHKDQPGAAPPPPATVDDRTPPPPPSSPPSPGTGGAPPPPAH